MNASFSKYPPELIEKAKKIKALIFDVDGVLTDGGIIYDNTGNEFKKFNVKDGQIIKYLKRSDILCGAITGRDSEVVKLRCKQMGLDFDFHGVKDKLGIYELIKRKYQLRDEEVAYIGDDIIDLSVLSRAGLAVVPSDGITYVQEHADLVTDLPGGKGVVREVADLILFVQEKLGSIVNDIISNNNNL